MSLESIIETYGYWAILVGTFLEGETILVLGGFAAHQGYMTLAGVIVAAFWGSFSGDQLFFHLGRRHSQAFLARRPSWKLRIDKAHRLLERFESVYIVGFRFLYGLRTVSPFVIGMSSVPTWKFILLNAIGAFLWAVVIGTSGYLFGSAAEVLIGNIKHYELAVLAAIAAIGIVIWATHLYFGRKKKSSSRGTR